mgnify:CR=1 FL=1
MNTKYLNSFLLTLLLIPALWVTGNTAASTFVPLFFTDALVVENQDVEVDGRLNVTAGTGNPDGHNVALTVRPVREDAVGVLVQTVDNTGIISYSQSSYGINAITVDGVALRGVVSQGGGTAVEATSGGSGPALAINGDIVKPETATNVLVIYDDAGAEIGRYRFAFERAAN